MRVNADTMMERRETSPLYFFPRVAQISRARSSQTRQLHSDVGAEEDIVASRLQLSFACRFVCARKAKRFSTYELPVWDIVWLQPR